MRARSAWLSHPKFKATWVALAAGSLAGLAVLGACSDAPVSRIAGPSVKIPDPRDYGAVGGFAHLIKVCIDQASTPGTYDFTVAKRLGTGLSDPTRSRPFELPPPAPADPTPGPNSGYTQSFLGPYTPGDILTAAPSLTVPVGASVPVCTTVFQRDDTPTHANNRMQNTVSNGIVNPYAVVDVLLGALPAGATYSALCSNDDPNLPQTPGCAIAPAWLNSVNYALNQVVTFGGTQWKSLQSNNLNHQPAENSFWTAQPFAPIVANPIYSAANVFHGSTITYTITLPPPQETPCPAGTFTWKIANGTGEANWPAPGAGNPSGIGDILVRYDQFPAPNDNSYGVNAVGWGDKGHTFGNLTGSDKAGIQISLGTTLKLSFNMDYLTSTTVTATTPSGYKAFGPNGGDGGMLTGTNAGIFVTTSLDNNLNRLNYCSAGNCTVGTGVNAVNLLQDSPPTMDKISDYTLTPAAAALFTNGWDFRNTYYARIQRSNPALTGFPADSAQAVNAGWVIAPNLTVLHNSPAKPCPAGPFPCADITVGVKTTKDKEEKVDVNNVNANTDAFVTGVHITWPSGTNGDLKQIKIGGDVIWSGTISGGTADLTLAQLTTDANKRKIGKNSDEDVKFVFANNAATSGYTASLDFGEDCNVVILP